MIETVFEALELAFVAVGVVGVVVLVLLVVVLLVFNVPSAVEGTAYDGFILIRLLQVLRGEQSRSVIKFICTLIELWVFNGLIKQLSLNGEVAASHCV